MQACSRVSGLTTLLFMSPLKMRSFAEEKEQAKKTKALDTATGVFGTFVTFKMQSFEPVDRTYFNIYRKHRREKLKQEELAAFQDICSNYSDIDVETYLTSGLSEESDFMLRIHSRSLLRTQDFLNDFQSKTVLGSKSSITHVSLGVTQSIKYITSEVSPRLNSKLFATQYSAAAPLYAIVVPVEKTAAWWTTPAHDRLKMIETHTDVTLQNLSNVRRKLYHGTGVTDADFITYFETTDIEEFHRLMLRLAQVPENLYHTKRGKPIVLSTIRTPEEIISRLL